MPKVIITRLNPQETEARGIPGWPIWTKEVSRFGHVYDDGPEECLFLEGEVTIETPEGNYDIRPGDFVIFEAGLDCTWDIHKPVKKHYNFP